MSRDYAKAKPVSVGDIPVIDFAPLMLQGNVTEVSKPLMSAALNTGFFYIKNHGIDPQVIQQALDASRHFFHLSQEEKALVAVNTNQRGWLGPKMATLEGAKTLRHCPN
jgi:isopenicillin N synthase-like dioxygenase